MGGGLASRRVSLGEGASVVLPCNFCFEGRERAVTRTRPRTRLAKEPGELECRFPGSTLLPLSLFFLSPVPWRPPPPLPAPLRPAELAPGPGPAPFPGSGRRWMEAETQGQGRGARSPGAPLCARGRPSSTRRPLPGLWARTRASDGPRPGESRFSVLRSASGLLPEIAARGLGGGAPCWGSVPES